MGKHEDAKLEQLAATLGHTFADIALLRLALTHRSYVYETPGVPHVTNERLEFFGDSILAYTTAEYLYRAYPKLDEGALTSIRAALVKTPTLARYARALDIGAYVLLGKGEEQNGGRQRDAILAATLEAVIGAMLLDAGLEVARAFVLGLITPEAKSVVTTRSDKDDKSIFQELAQARLGQTPIYRVVAVEGPSHERTYTVEALIGDLVVARGEGPSKQRAEQAAAHLALSQEGWQISGSLPT